jgi:hypothetical protein
LLHRSVARCARPTSRTTITEFDGFFYLAIDS